MANFAKRLPNNAEGPFFVDSTCINCDTCRALASEVFADDGEYSFVFHQPENSQEERHALHALLACPTASIGTRGKNQAQEAREDFPMLLEDGVYYTGFNSEKSFGGNSYFIHRPEGNWLVDSPRYLPFLERKFAALGGISHIFLTHRDDVADSAQYAKRFASQRIIHERDMGAQKDAERIIAGEDPVPISEDFLIIPTPGHTRGHCVLLYKNRYLFSGDHLWWSRRTNHLGASRSVCWYSWPEQTKSMERLLGYSFEWVLPGHGRRVKLPADVIKRELGELVAEMRGLKSEE